MSENETGFYKLQDNVQQAFLFRDRVQSLVSIGTISEEDIIERLENRIKGWEESSQFRENVKQCLIDLVGKDLTDDEAISEIKRLQQVAVDGSSSRSMTGIAQFLGLPDDTKQPDICFAIMELKNKNKKYFKDSFQLEVIAKYLKLPGDCKPSDIFTEVIELKEELTQSKKIIARLVGE